LGEDVRSCRTARHPTPDDSNIHVVSTVKILLHTR